MKLTRLAWTVGFGVSLMSVQLYAGNSIDVTNDFTCVFSGGNADWDDEGDWSNCGGGIPNNDGTSTFDAVVDGGDLDIDGATGDITIDDLFLNGGVIDQTSVDLSVDTLNIANGAEFNLGSGATLMVELLTGELNALSGSTLAGTPDNPFTISADGSIDVRSGTTVLTGNLVNDGTISFDSGNTSTTGETLFVSGDVTLSGNGTLNLSGDTFNEITGNAEIHSPTRRGIRSRAPRLLVAPS